MIDQDKREIDYLRISVTDKCNLRCTYCMPEEGVKCMQHTDLLTFEEIVTICKSAAKLGIRKIKLTGGEPLVRKGFVSLVRMIKQIEGIEEITLTTNGIALGDQIDELIDAGISAINMSLDTLDAKKFTNITRVDALEKVLQSIKLASERNLKVLKLNCLAVKEYNEDEICKLAAFAKEKPIAVRFIELMPIGPSKSLTPISKERLIEKLETAYGPMKPYQKKLGNGPAAYWEIEGFKGQIGFISAVSGCFCEKCNRVRLTAEGFLKQCLYYNEGLDLKTLLRNGITEEALTKKIEEVIFNKPSRHHFGDDKGHNIEEKIMAQIGG